MTETTDLLPMDGTHETLVELSENWTALLAEAGTDAKGHLEIAEAFGRAMSRACDGTDAATVSSVAEYVAFGRALLAVACWKREPETADTIARRAEVAEWGLLVLVYALAELDRLGARALQQDSYVAALEAQCEARKAVIH